jgi:hypothetical protein
VPGATTTIVPLRSTVNLASSSLGAFFMIGSGSGAKAVLERAHLRRILHTLGSSQFGPDGLHHQLWYAQLTACFTARVKVEAGLRSVLRTKPCEQGFARQSVAPALVLHLLRFA